MLKSLNCSDFFEIVSYYGTLLRRSRVKEKINLTICVKFPHSLHIEQGFVEHFVGPTSSETHGQLVGMTCYFQAKFYNKSWKALSRLAATG